MEPPDGTPWRSGMEPSARLSPSLAFCIIYVAHTHTAGTQTEKGYTIALKACPHMWQMRHTSCNSILQEEEEMQEIQPACQRCVYAAWVASSSFSMFPALGSCSFLLSQQHFKCVSFTISFLVLCVRRVPHHTQWHTKCSFLEKELQEPQEP